MGAFDGKVAIVTGATAGIGRCTALAFARQGAKVALAGRRAPAGEAAAREIQAAGGQAFFLQTDVRSEDQVAALVAKTLATFGRLDFAFNAAAIEQFAPLAAQTAAAFADVMATNATGTFLCMKHQIPAIAKGGGGAIVNASSIAGAAVGVENNSPYSASKAAVVGLTKTAALEAGAQRIRVNAIACCSIDTEMAREAWKKLHMTPEQIAALNPIGRLGKPEDVAAAVLFLCSEPASYITGTTLTVDGGYTAGLRQAR